MCGTLKFKTTTGRLWSSEMSSECVRWWEGMCGQPLADILEGDSWHFRRDVCPTALLLLWVPFSTKCRSSQGGDARTRVLCQVAGLSPLCCVTSGNHLTLLSLKRGDYNTRFPPLLVPGKVTREIYENTWEMLPNRRDYC